MSGRVTCDALAMHFRPLQFLGGMETLFLSDLFVQRYEGRFAHSNFDLNPDYQRGHVWTQAQQEAFMGHMLEGGATPLVVCNRVSIAVDEVVDGKQRLTAFYRWYTGQIDGVTDNFRINIADLDDDARRWMASPSGLRMTIGYVSLPRAEVLRLYLRLNRGGTIHADMEIENVCHLLAVECGEVAVP